MLRGMETSIQAPAPAYLVRVPRSYSAGILVRALSVAKSHPDSLFETPDRERMTAAQYRRWFMKCLHRKINRNEPERRGRKDCAEWWWETWRLASKVNTRRLIVRKHEVPLEFRDKLEHRIWNEEWD